MPLRRHQAPRSYRPVPPCLPGFTHIHRYWERSGQRVIARLKPGEYYVSLEDEILTTTLGSCIAACIHDRRLRIGGMNHFMLPQYVEGSQGHWDVTDPSEANRYGNFAMENLINGILSQGGRRQDLEVKLFGAGRVLRLDLDVSDRNAAFAMAYIENEGLNLVASDLGGDLPLTVRYLPRTGQAFVKRLAEQVKKVSHSERRYLHEIQTRPVGGELEFF